MTLAVTGCGILSPAGKGTGALASAMAHGWNGPAAETAALYSEPLPTPSGRTVPGFDVRQELGRKGTSFLDRRSSLALVACHEAIADGRLQIDDSTRHRIGIALGTTWGSLRAMSDYTKDSLLEARPYLVNPAMFPNTVMNCAAGQVAIWFGLRGVNATIAGGQMAFLNGIEYARNILRRGYVDTLLIGGVEEFTPHSAWASALTDERPALRVAEAAALFVVESADTARRAGKHLDADVLSVATAFSPGGQRGGNMARGLGRSIERVLAAAGVAPSEIAIAATCQCDGDGYDIEGTAIDGAGLTPTTRVRVRQSFGECHAATGALQLAAVLALHREDPSRDGQASLLTGWTKDGGVGAAVVRAWSRVGSDCR